MSIYIHATVELCPVCLTPAKSGEGYIEYACEHSSYDHEPITVECRIDPYEAYCAQRIATESEWQPLIEACDTKRAAIARGEHGYLYRSDGLRYVPEHRAARAQARWSKTATAALFSDTLKDSFIDPLRQHFNRQAFGWDAQKDVYVVAPGSSLKLMGLDVQEHAAVPDDKVFMFDPAITVDDTTLLTTHERREDFWSGIGNQFRIPISTGTRPPLGV